GLRAGRRPQSLRELLEAELPAYRPFQNVRANLAQHLHCLAIALPVKHLAFRLRHPGIGAETDRGGSFSCLLPIGVGAFSFLFCWMDIRAAHSTCSPPR